MYCQSLPVKDFEHDIGGMWNEHSCMMIWTFFVTAFFGIEMKTDLF